MEEPKFVNGVIHLITTSPANHAPIVRTFHTVTFSEMLFVRHKCENAELNGSCIVIIDYYDYFNEKVESKGYCNLSDAFIVQIKRRLLNL